eukprot:6884634-Ditylum_brightwellii.AAC.1
MSIRHTSPRTSVVARQKVALLAKDLLQKDRESNTPSQSERLQQFITSEDASDIYIFDQYYIGIKFKGEKRFSPSAGPPGSINDARSFRILQLTSESRFCDRDRELAKLSQ